MNNASADDLSIRIRDCNSISDATITLRRSALNIKYGPNGSGKSTIARALDLRARDEGSLGALLPFKYRGSENAPSPSVVGGDSINKVLVFDDEYVRNFVFQRDEVLKDSFEVFINTDEYRAGIAQIDDHLKALIETFSQWDEFDATRTAFELLRDAFNVTKSGAISKSSKGSKAIGMVEKIANIPDPLMGYKQFIEGDDPASWITWQARGKAFLDQSDNCPFCSVSGLNKQVANQVSEVYESAAVKTLSALRQAVQQLGDYFEEGKRERLQGILTGLGDVSLEQTTLIVNIRNQVVAFLEKLTALRTLSFHTLQNADDVNGLLLGLKIDLPVLDALNSVKTASIVGQINSKIDQVATRINELRAELGRHNSRVADLIRVNQNAVNEFLRSAGYRYTVKIETTESSYRMIVEHEDAAGHLESAKHHLSYGEKNAFALVLFMYHVRKEQPDLVILDDPVSSFDKTKKFAIIHQLFKGKNSIRDFTTLLLTHDIEPVIDLILNPTSGQFASVKPAAHFLQSRAGTVQELPIERSHIATFSQICKANIEAASDDVIKCIYLRRYYEVHGERDCLEFQILSSLVHLYDVPMQKGLNGTFTQLSAESVTAGMENIRKWIPTLDYEKVVQDLKSPAIIKAKFDATDVGYEKVQLFRVLLNDKKYDKNADNALQKFVNETYHIENEYVMQLNPCEFDAVPEYVVTACGSRLAEAVGQ